MRTETRTVYIARDGKECATEALCKAHERKTCGSALIGLTEAQIEAARTGAAPDLAEAFETFGYELRKARQASRRLKRRPSEIAGDTSQPPLREEPASALEADSPAGTEPEPAEAS